jgi:cytochrome oxidase Cu insertion factor (SCO1/SenC/PrrC family)
MSRTRKIALIAISILVLLGGLVAWKMQLPKPQSSFADLQPAPDFTLNDQDGKPFTLSSLRGSPVVLVFYRGYW